MKKILSLIIVMTFIASACLTAVSGADLTFIDVKENRWSYDSIVYAVGKGYMNGTGDNKFSPASSLTRAMVATVLYRREGSPAVSGSSGFSDVKANQWYTDGITWAKSTGVVNGLSETTFGPMVNITREQLATMLCRYSSSAPVSVPERADLAAFPDGAKVSDWAKDAVAWAIQAGLIKGTDKGEIDPKGLATREQFAAIMQRYDSTFMLQYNKPVLMSSYTEPEYDLVTDADFYVAVNGDDSADGSFDHPFATFGKAVEAVRGLDRNGRDGITVAFMAGEYGPLDVDFTSADSGTVECPITYCKYGDGDVIFNNGIDFSSDKFVPLDDAEKSKFSDKAKDKIMKVDMSDVIPKGEYDLSYSLFSDQGICTVARFPNKYTNGTDQLFEGAETTSLNTIKLYNPQLIRRMTKYSDISGLKIYGKITYEWFKDTLSVGSYDYDTLQMSISDVYNARSYMFTGGLRWEYDKNGKLVYKEDIKLAFLNMPEDLDVDGEFWVDQENSVLYVYDPSGDYHMVIKEDMINMDMTDDITFRGFDFRNSRDSFISGSYCHGISIDQCSFRCCGGMFAIEFSDHDRERDLDFSLTNSKFDLGYDAFVHIYGTGTTFVNGKAYRMNGIIDNNSFTNYGLYLNEECGVYITHIDGFTVSHNEFINSGRGAIFYNNAQNSVIEYNYMSDQMLNAEDGGALSTWMNIENRNNIIRYNIIKDVSNAGVGGFGFYLDDYSAGNDIYSNLFFNCNGSAAVVHDGRDNLLRNNVVINPKGGASEFTVTSGNLYSNATGEFDDREEEILQRYINLFKKYDSDPDLKSYALKYWPDIFSLSTDPADWESSDFVLARNNTFTGNLFLNSKAEIGVLLSGYPAMHSTIEENIAYTLDENPVFVNPSTGDYRIKEGSGYPDISFEKIGRY